MIRRMIWMILTYDSIVSRETFKMTGPEMAIYAVFGLVCMINSDRRSHAEDE